MDVTCERCGTEYEFEETLVSDRGTTVKCTNCGHLFKVYRPGAEPSRGDESGRTWQLRTTSGETLSFGSLKELQRLIAEGKVSEDDRLARTGEGWKRLGDIAELGTFFAAARAARRPPVASGKGTILGMGGPRREPDLSPPPPPPRARAAPSSMPPPPATPPVVPSPSSSPPRPGGSAASSRPRSEPPPPRRTGPRTDQTMRGLGPGEPRSLRSNGEAEAATLEVPIPPPPRLPAALGGNGGRTDTRTEERRSDSRRPPSVRPLRLDDDASAGPVRRNLTPVWLGLLVLALGGGGAFWAWPWLGGAGSREPASPADRFIDAGERALARDRRSAYDDAAEEFTKALAIDERDVRALVGLSRAHALKAQARLFEADDLEERSAEDPTARGEASALRRAAAEEAAEARAAAEAAVRTESGGADAELALADALRLVGERDLAQSRLARALTLGAGSSAEALRVQALMAAASHGPGPAGLAAARDLAAQAVAADGSLLRARLLLARASLAAGDPEAARREAEAVLARDGTHDEALALRDRAVLTLHAARTGSSQPSGSSSTLPTAPGPRASPPSSSRSAAPQPAAQTPEARTSGTSGSAPSTGSASAEPSTNSARDYAGLVREGQTRLERGQVAAARQAFEAALRIRAGGAEALTGIGYVMLNEGNAQGAVRQFTTAATAGHADALIGLGDAHRRLGQREQALEAYRRYLQVSPSGAHAAMARRHVETLSGGSSTPSAGPAQPLGVRPSGSSAAAETEPPSVPVQRPPADTPAIESEP